MIHAYPRSTPDFPREANHGRTIRSRRNRRAAINNVNLKSTDGVHWTHLDADADHAPWQGFVNSAELDPTNPQHLVLTYHEHCEPPHRRSCIPRLHTIESWLSATCGTRSRARCASRQTIRRLGCSLGTNSVRADRTHPRWTEDRMN